MPWRIAVITGALMVIGVVAAGVAIHLPGRAGGPAAGQASLDGAPVTDALGRTVANGVGLAISALPRAKATSGAKATRPIKVTAPSHAKKSAPAARAVTTKPRRAHRKPAVPVYLNPLRALSGLIPERIDMGADFGGSGPIYAIGNAVITNATTSAGWPGGGWVSYQLTDGPAAGLVVFLAEDVTPTVQVGQHVTSSTVIANMFVGGSGIETGWATPDSSTAESQLAVAGGVSGGGPFPTRVALNFDALLVALGVPAGPNAGQAPYGLLPSNYPTNWSGVKATS